MDRPNSTDCGLVQPGCSRAFAIGALPEAVSAARVACLDVQAGSPRGSVAHGGSPCLFLREKAAAPRLLAPAGESCARDTEEEVAGRVTNRTGSAGTTPPGACTPTSLSRSSILLGAG